MNTAVHDAQHLGWKLAWVLRGWAGPELLDTYERERRPIGIHNVAQSANEDTSHYDIPRSLVEDIGGRVPHAWVAPKGARVSTIDLLGPGLTLLAGPGGAAWCAAAADLAVPMPVAAHLLDGAAAQAVGAGRDGAVLVRPDGQVVAGWEAGAAPEAAAARIGAAVAGLVGERAPA